MVNQFLNQNQNMLNFENQNKLQEVNSESDDENTQELLHSEIKASKKPKVEERDCLDSSLSETENCSLLNTNYVDKDSDDEEQAP